MLSPGMQRLRPGRLRNIDLINLFAVVVAVLCGLFILTGTVPVIFVLAPLTALGMDGILRSHPTGRLRDAATSAWQVLLPTTSTVAAALFFRYVSVGYWGLLAAFVTGLLAAAVAYAEYAALDADAETGGLPRVVLLAAAYAGLFALIGVFYAYDLSPGAAALLVGVAGAIFAIEVFQELEATPTDLAIYSIATGFALAQVRWAIGYVSLDGLLAAIFIVLVFYVLTGLTLAGLARRLNRRVYVEYVIVGIVGVVIVVASRAATGA